MGAETRQPGRKPRADAERNRERLLEAAKAGFAEAGPEVSLEDIARRAGVGIGTLYRHFPTRAAVVEAVYRREVQQLADAATRLLETSAPADALHAWLLMCVDYIATKKVIAPALASIPAGSDVYAASGSRLTDAMTLLVERAAAAGEIRADVDAGDLLRVLTGFIYASTGPDWALSARRMIDIVMDGLRAKKGAASDRAL